MGVTSVILLLLFVGICTPGSSLATPSNNGELIPGEYIVRLHPHVQYHSKEELFRGLFVGAQIELGGRSVVHIKHANDEIAQSLAQSPLVDHMEPNRIIQLVHPVEMKEVEEVIRQPLYEVDSGHHDPDCEEQTGEEDDIWHLIRTSHRELPNYQEDAYKFKHDGSGVNIYILDTGINTDHPDFENRAFRGMTAHELYCLEGHEDLHGHGTSVASLAGGITWGVAKGATLYSGKCLNQFGSGTTMGIVEAVDWCTDHHKNQTEAGIPGNKPRGIINMSFGSNTFSPIFEEALDEAPQSWHHPHSSGWEFQHKRLALLSYWL